MSVELNITMDEDLYQRLKKELPPKRIGVFINDAVRARLQADRQTLDAQTLDAAYKAARQEPWRREIADDWEPTETEDWPA